MNKFLKAKQKNLGKEIEKVHDQIASGEHSKTQIEAEATPTIKERTVKEKAKSKPKVELKKAKPAKTVKKTTAKASSKPKPAIATPVENKGSEEISGWVSGYIDQHNLKLNESMFDDLFGDADNEVNGLTSMNYHELPIKLVEKFLGETNLTFVDKAFIADRMGSELVKVFDKSLLTSIDKSTLEAIKKVAYKRISLKKSEIDEFSETTQKGTLKYAIMIAAELIGKYKGGKELVDSLLST